MDSSKRLLKAGDFMGGGKGGGGGGGGGGIPPEFSELVTEWMNPYMEKWIATQMGSPLMDASYLASGIDWGGTNKKGNATTNPGRISLNSAMNGIYREPKPTTTTSTQQTMNSPIFGYGAGVGGWQVGNQPYPWHTGGSGYNPNSGIPAGVMPHITPNIPNTKQYLANSKTSMRGV